MRCSAGYVNPPPSPYTGSGLWCVASGMIVYDLSSYVLLHAQAHIGLVVKNLERLREVGPVISYY